MFPHTPYFGITPQYYGFVGIPPPTLAAMQPVLSTPIAVTTSAPAVSTSSETPSTQYVREKPPVTTVFVGNISERAPDQLIKTLLMRCGNILSWKRVQGASGKLQAFGFCEYEDPESTMRCVRLLNGLGIGDKKLLVKVDPKTEDLLTEYKKKKEEKGETGTMGATAEEIDSSTLRDDEGVKTALADILKEHSSLLDGSESPRKSDSYLEGPRHLTMEDMDLDDERKDLINREIEIFRRRNEKEDQIEPPPRRPKPREFDRPPGAGLQLYASYVESDKRDRELRREKYGIGTSRSPEKRKIVDEEEEAIRKKLERKLREKEESYQKRLKQWELRERKKANEYEHEREHEQKRQRELQIEAQRLREFFEDYDDEVEDPKYYRGSALHQRLKDREVEEAADERDRQKEVEQIEAAKRKLIEEKDVKAESIIFQMEQKMQEHLRRRLTLHPTVSDSESETDEHPRAETLTSIGKDLSEPQKELDNKGSPEKVLSGTPAMEETDSGPQHFHPTEFVTQTLDEASANLPRDGSGTFLFAMNAAESVVRKKAAAFTEDEPEEKAKKPSLSWLPPSAFTSTAAATETTGTRSNGIDTMSAAAVVATFTNEERNALIKRIIKGIPTAKRDIFNYPIDWDVVDANFINTRIKPWVDKKIIGYIGEAEATLSSFICDQLLHHYKPERILSDIAMVLDEEAEVFVVKMWRLLIYVIAEKKAGLSS